MKYKLVKFIDGRYGARAWWFGYKFADLRDYQYTWRSLEYVHKYCKGTQEQALAAISVLSDRGALV